MGFFAFHTSAEDAEFLAEELGGGLNKQDLLELGHYQCYARITDARTGERLPAFTVRLDPPPASDPRGGVDLAAQSAARYGRDALDIELNLQAAAERVTGRSANRPNDDYPAAAESSGDASGGVSPARARIGAEVPQRARVRGKPWNGPDRRTGQR
jgi:hypothetical protein